MSELDNYLEFAKTLAKDAGKIMLEHFSIGINKQLKADKSPVTIADSQVNALVITRVKQNFPDHSVLGEEESHGDHGLAEYTWVVDPIDGTRPYAMAVPTNVLSLALTHNGKPVIAVVYDPYMDRLYWAQKGRGAYLNGQKITVNDHAQIDHLTHFGLESFWKPYKYPFLESMSKQKAHHMSFGSTVYASMLVARGELDFIIFGNDTAHDCAASALIIEEAGGIATDIDGNPQRYDQPINGFIAGNKLIHPKIVQAIKQHTLPR